MATIAISLAGLPFLLPHVLEDFAHGIAQRVGLSPGAGAFLLGGFLALQSLGLVLVARERRGGWALTFWVGVIWLAGATLEHGPALARGGFRSGAESIAWLSGLVVTQTCAAALAWRGWRGEGPSG